MAATPTLKFQVYRGDKLLLERSFTEPSVSIGRSAAALLKVDDPTLGELHAVLNVEDDGTVQLLDLGTEAGTTYKGQKISNVVLGSGDAFDLGGLRVVVRFDEREHTTPTMDVRPVGAAGDMPTDDDATELAEQEDLDVLDMLIRAGNQSAGANTKVPKVLEVSHVWGDALLDSKQFARGHTVTVGPSFGHKWMLFGNPMGWVPENMSGVLSMSPPIWSDVQEVWSSDFYTPADVLPANDDHNLFLADARGWTARLDASWDGFADIGTERLTFDQLVQQGRARRNGNIIEIPMSDDTSLAVDIHGVVFFARMVHPTAVAISSPERDYAFLGVSSVCSFLFVMLALVYQFSPPRPESDMMSPDDRLVELVLQKKEEPPPEEKQDDKEKNEDAGEGAKAKKEEGKVGKQDAKLDKAKGEKLSSAVQDREVAENAGLLGALNDPNNMLSSGLDASLSSGIGGLIGTRGSQIGAGGLGMRGSGLGGGGTASGLGGLGSRGSGLGGSGTGSGGGEFGKGGSLGSKGSGTVTASSGEPIVMGGLDRSLIDAVIKRKMSQIKYCYQRELQKDPSLSGKLTIQFTIAKDGTVSQAKTHSSTVGSSAVDQCVVQRFYQMQFPEPKGGGIVVVKYPFIFSGG
jgi:TonB family protein